MSAKDYSYWQDVINILFPIFQKYDIHIVQIGLNSEHQYQYVVDYRGKTNMNQLAYVIKNAALHFGSDSFGVHLASGYDIPIVALYSVSPKNVSGPYFGNPDKQVIFESFLRTGNKKASYSSEENPKSINLIRPEEIANAIFKQLGIDFVVPFETVYTGEKYGFDKIRDFIPSSVMNISHPDIPIEIRMDLNFNEDILFKQLSLNRGIIITDKNINLDMLKRFKSNIHALIYEVKENDDPTFIINVKKVGIPVVLISYLTEEQIAPKKINYYENGKINLLSQEKKEKIQELRNEIDLLYYRTNKIVIENGKVFSSNSARIAGLELKNDFDFQKVIDTTEFWKEISFFHIIKKLDIPSNQAQD